MLFEILWYICVRPFESEDKKKIFTFLRIFNVENFGYLSVSFLQNLGDDYRRGNKDFLALMSLVDLACPVFATRKGRKILGMSSYAKLEKHEVTTEVPI